MKDKSSVAPRAAWGAAAFSLLACGVGHIYCGKIVRGVFLFCIWALLPMMGLVLAVIEPSVTGFFLLMLVPAFGLVAIYLLAVVDAYRLARRAAADYELKDYNRSSLYALLVVVGLIYPIGVVALYREVLFEAFVVPTRSMAPNIVARDRVLANKWVARKRSPRRGELVVFFAREHPGRRWVKRVVGLPGDKIEIRGDEVLVNGESLRVAGVHDGELKLEGESRGRLIAERAGDAIYVTYQDEDKPVDEEQKQVEFVLPAGGLYVLGDNRPRSKDSRHFGHIHMDDVLGHVQYLYYPAKTWRRFGVKD